MIKNYFLTAVRSLTRHKFFSFINIFGLAVAMTICMALIMLVADQMMYDRHNSKRDRIYRVVTMDTSNKGLSSDGNTNSASCMPLRDELLEKYTGIEKAVRLKRGFGNGWLELENQNVNIPLAGFYADPGVFEFFEYEFEHGDQATALNEPYTVVLTRKAANKLFKEENPLGKTVKVGDINYTVTGVLKETSNKSHIVFDGLASMATLKSLQAQGKFPDELDNWMDFWNGWTYVLLDADKSPDDIQKHLDKIYKDHIAVAPPDSYKMKFGLQSIGAITPGPMLNNPIGPSFPWFFVYVLGGLAGVILITSCFNFTNLSIARSLTRAREIGVRKVTGAARWQIFVQFLSESIVVAMAALCLSLVLLFLIKPLVLQLNFARIFHWDFEFNYVVGIAFIGFAIIVGVLAGFFPAVVLSSLQPVKVLKSLNNIKLFSKIGLRKALLVSQFTLSLIFILSVILMYNQLSLFMTTEHGFNMEQNIMVRLNGTSASALKTELAKYPTIHSASGASHVPAAGTSHGSGFSKTLGDKDMPTFGIFYVDEDYISNMQLELIAGRFYSPENAETNKNYIVINQAAVKKLDYKTAQDAIGELVYQSDSTQKTIIGVVRDYNHRDLTRVITPMALMYNPSNTAVLQVRYTGTYQEAGRSLEAAWASVNPGLKIDYTEVSAEIRKFYQIIFGDIVSVLLAIAFLAIMISCLGLLGMATYATETRIKEISIRKILGSSASSLVFLLSKGFVSVLLIAILIAAPASYFLNTMWLELIAYHVSFDFVTVATGVGILLVFGVITIGSQTIRATFINPVDNLKND